MKTKEEILKKHYRGMAVYEICIAMQEYSDSQNPLHQINKKELRDEFFKDLVRQGNDDIPEFKCSPHNVFEWLIQNQQNPLQRIKEKHKDVIPIINKMIFDVPNKSGNNETIWYFTEEEVEFFKDLLKLIK